MTPIGVGEGAELAAVDLGAEVVDGRVVFEQVADQVFVVVTPRNEEIVHTSENGLRRLDRALDGTELREPETLPGSSWAGVPMEDGSVVLGANSRRSALLGVRVGADGSVERIVEGLPSAGSGPEVVGPSDVILGAEGTLYAAVFNDDQTGQWMPLTPETTGMDAARIAVFTGEADPMIPPEQVAGFKQEMESAGADFFVVSYPGVKHSFTNPEADDFAARFDMPLGYDEAADSDSWAQTQTFLADLFK